MSGLAVARLLIAIEFKEPVRPGSVYFDRAHAALVANALAFELKKHLSTLDELGLVWMAAVFDVAQVLRPGFPVFTELQNLYQAGVRDPLHAPQVMTLSALRGEAPSPELAPDLELMGGAFVVIPALIIGPPARVAEVNERLESELMDAGLVDPRIALCLHDALALEPEHVRLMTLTDLCAMSASQLQHVGLGPVWDVLEQCLFVDQGALLRELPSGLRLGTDLQGTAWVEFLTIDNFRKQSPLSGYPDYLLTQRQTFALLDAHGVNFDLRAQSEAESVEFDDGPQAAYLIEWQQQGAGLSHAEVILAGPVGAVVLLLYDGETVVGMAYPLEVRSLQALKNRLNDQCRGGLSLKSREFVEYANEP